MPPPLQARLFTLLSRKLTEDDTAATWEQEAPAGVQETAELSGDRAGQRLVSTQTVQHDYLTLSGRVARETITTDGTVTAILDFIYDESGKPFALNYSADGGMSFNTYYYVLNLQGDVVKLISYIPGFEYEEVANYTYDAWGNIISATGEKAELNPLRYRGYYYDSETGFYYLQSRYYDPANHRFINADALASTGQGFVGTNMFAYCNNNPVIFADTAGNTFESVVAEESQEFYFNGSIVTISVEIVATMPISERVTVSSSKTGLGYEVEVGDEHFSFTLKHQSIASSSQDSVAWKYCDYGIMVSLDIVEGLVVKSDPIPLTENLDMRISVSLRDASWYDDAAAWLSTLHGGAAWGAGSNAGYTGGGAVYAEGGGICGLNGIRGRYLAIV